MGCRMEIFRNVSFEHKTKNPLPFRMLASLQETISTSHSLPDQPGAHVQVYCGPFCEQVAPFSHGLFSHLGGKKEFYRLPVSFNLIYVT